MASPEKKKKRYHLTTILTLARALTTENFPSPNHMTHRVPSAALLRPVIHQDTMRPGHQEKPRSFPQASSPMPKPRPSCGQRQRQISQSGSASELIPPQVCNAEERKRAGNFGTERNIHQRRRKNNTSHFTISLESLQENLWEISCKLSKSKHLCTFKCCWNNTHVGPLLPVTRSPIPDL